MKERIAVIALILFIAAISLLLSTKVVITQPNAARRLACERTC